MDIDIILEERSSPEQVRELAVAAERFGIRAVWLSNYHSWWDPFVSLVPAALGSELSANIWSNSSRRLSGRT